MRDRKVLILVGIGVLAVFAVLFLFVLGGGDAEPQAQPPAGSTSSGQRDTSEQEMDGDDLPADTGAPRVFGVSSRDPFTPQVDPDEDSGTSADSTSSSSQDGSRQDGKTTTGKKSTDSKPSGAGANESRKEEKPSGSGTGESTEKKTDEPKNRAPVPIGAGKKSNPDGDRTELTVVEVRASQAVARINNLRTTLYLSVPDPSGVTFVSSLGGGCGWFTLEGAEDRLSICEGQTRQM